MPITFLPYQDFTFSAACLDDKRLGKQRVEVLMILNAIRDPNHSLRSHPIYKIWAKYPNALVEYGLTVCDEWILRGKIDNLRDQIEDFKSGSVLMPWWLGKQSFHASHRGNLLRKDPVWYGKFGWTDSPLLYYEWPIDNNHHPSCVGSTSSAY